MDKKKKETNNKNSIDKVKEKIGIESNQNSWKPGTGTKKTQTEKSK